MILTIWAFFYVFISMSFLLPFGFIAMFFYALGLRKSMRLVIYRIAQGWARSLMLAIGSKVTINGKENIPRGEGVCFVCNHTGYFDIVLMLAHASRPIGFIAKKELLFVPLVNAWIFLVGGLFIDRSNIKKAFRTINKGVKRIKSGGGMIIFPEGHRSKGQGLLPFHAGSLKLATMAEAPIVPVVLEGSYDVFEKNSRVKKTSLNITFCEPIRTADLPSSDRKIVLCDKIYSVIKEKLDSRQ